MTEKQFNVFDVDGTIFLEDHKKGSYHIGEIENVDVICLNDIASRLNELHEENKRLKSINQDYGNYIGDFEDDFIRLAEENKKLQERNDRQYKQLGDLYRLIEEKDWRALSDIMDDFKKAEEQLQKEWSEYND